MEYPLVEPADDRARKLDWRVGKQVRCRRVPVFLRLRCSVSLHLTPSPYSNNPAGPFSVLLPLTRSLPPTATLLPPQSFPDRRPPSIPTRINPQILGEPRPYGSYLPRTAAFSSGIIIAKQGDNPTR